MIDQKRTSNEVGLDIVLPQLQSKNKGELFLELSRGVSGIYALERETVYQELVAACEPATVQDGVAVLSVEMESLRRPICGIATLRKPVGFDADDSRPVDLVFVLILPKEDGGKNLYRLSRATRLFKNDALCEELREAQDENGIYGAFMAHDAQPIAA